QSFTLFKPKDIVSGDFYFFSKQNDTILIAATDCTGHGVPGALMSMIGMEHLHDAVEQSDNPADILSILNKGIKKSLHQSQKNDSTRDGMDIALCAVQGNSLTYAGANRPLWIIRSNSDTIEEIKPTKRAIGGFTEGEQLFEQHTLDLQSGDTIYLFSDGYADQFGGPNGKKLTTRKFKNALLSLKHKRMYEQEQELDKLFEEWKQEEEQVDDVLIIGVRV
ncbi:MAG TPA: SpoIIE family protein phosphatase, partial [Bacteroidia bacterium]|nr:SpoIIE family protein phosphatase [Bacteroidia bacterium]